MNRLEDYKGYMIIVDNDGFFKASNDPVMKQGYFGEEDSRAETLEQLKKSIDTITNSSVNGLEVRILAEGMVRIGKITSMKQKRYGSEFTYKVSWKDSSGKQRFDECAIIDFIKDTEHNRSLIEGYNTMKIQAKKLYDKAHDAEKEFEHFKQGESLK